MRRDELTAGPSCAFRGMVIERPDIGPVRGPSDAVCADAAILPAHAHTHPSRHFPQARSRPERFRHPDPPAAAGPEGGEVRSSKALRPTGTGREASATPRFGDLDPAGASEILRPSSLLTMDGD